MALGALKNLWYHSLHSTAGTLLLCYDSSAMTSGDGAAARSPFAAAPARDIIIARLAGAVVWRGSDHTRSSVPGPSSPPLASRRYIAPAALASCKHGWLARVRCCTLSVSSSRRASACIARSWKMHLTR
ncbi:unnamed protein product [Cercospora beticola]|nr:unnamed protein product [Cercospora beticola]